MKKTELILFGLLILTLILNLQNFTWTMPILFAEFIGLIGIWIYGHFKTKDLDKSELIERLFTVLLILGIILNVAEISFSNLIISIGLLFLTGYMAFKGIRKVIIKDIFTGIELILLGLIFLGFLMRLRHFPGGSPIRVFSASLLSLLYLAISINFIIVSVKANKQTLGVVGMILYWSLSAYVNAILFDTMFWPGEMNLFYSALISSLIVLPILIIQTLKHKELSSDYSIQIKNLYKRTIILISISLFFAIATPKQFLRMDFGIRPEMINSYFDCRLNYELDNLSKEKACQEFQTLNEIWIFGYYPEGLTKEDVEILKQDYKNY